MVLKFFASISRGNHVDQFSFSLEERERERSIRAVQRVYLIRYRVNYQRSSIRIDNDNIILTCKLIFPMPATRSNRERVILNTFESKEGRKEVPLQVPLNFKEAIFRGECKRSREMKRTQERRTKETFQVLTTKVIFANR